MAITGAHMLLYTPEAEALRSVFKDTLAMPHVDAHDGWLIFKLPPAEIAVHPSEGSAAHQISFMCDDIHTTIAELSEKGIEFEGEVQDQGWGITTNMVLPGSVKVMLYQPRHPVAHSL
jgi:hypothetical protein